MGPPSFPLTAAQPAGRPDARTYAHTHAHARTHGHAHTCAHAHAYTRTHAREIIGWPRLVIVWFPPVAVFRPVEPSRTVHAEPCIVIDLTVNPIEQRRKTGPCSATFPVASVFLCEFMRDGVECVERFSRFHFCLLLPNTTAGLFFSDMAPAGDGSSTKKITFQPLPLDTLV